MISKDAILSVIVGFLLTGLVGMNQRVFGDSFYVYGLYPAKVDAYANISDSEKSRAKGIFLVRQQRAEKEKIPPAAEEQKGHPKKRQKGLEGVRPHSDDKVPKRESGKQQSAGSTSVFPGCSPSK